MENRPITLSTEPQTTLVRRFMDFHESFSLDTITRLQEIYTQDIEFISPLLHGHGILALLTHCKTFFKGVEFYQRRYLDFLIGEHCAYLSWEMDYAHARVALGRPVTVRGSTHIRYTSRVYFQEDCFDVGAMLYDHVWGLSAATRAARRRVLR